MECLSRAFIVSCDAVLEHPTSTSKPRSLEALQVHVRLLSFACSGVSACVSPASAGSSQV